MPRTIKRLPKLTKDQILWLAGWLEGEGTFGWSGCGRYPKKYPRIQAGSTDKDVIERIAELLGLNTYFMAKPNKVSKKPFYRFVLNNQQALDLMHLILPHMGERRSARIQQILDNPNMTKVDI